MGPRSHYRKWLLWGGNDVGISPHVVNQRSNLLDAEAVEFHIKFSQWKIPLRCAFHLRDIPKPISWLAMAKLNLSQQKHTFTYQKKCTTTQNKHKKTKARFSRLLQHLAWKRRGSVLVSVLHKFVTYPLIVPGHKICHFGDIIPRQSVAVT